MAYSLVGERPRAAASSRPLLWGLFAFVQKRARARAERLALARLLEMDDARLDDLGLVRQDIRLAMAAARLRTGSLNGVRARRARAWLLPKH